MSASLPYAVLGAHLPPLADPRTENLADSDPDRNVIARAGDWFKEQLGEVLNRGAQAGQAVVEFELADLVRDRTGRPLAPADTVDRAAQRGDQGTNASASGNVSGFIGGNLPMTLGIVAGGLGLVLLMRK